MTNPAIKPNHKAIKAYYEALRAYDRQDVEHETALRTAFQSLLEQLGRQFAWTLIPELSDKAAGKAIRPDGTFRDDYYITRGHWEAKDSHDHLETEIKKKIAKGYRLGNRSALDWVVDQYQVSEDKRSGICSDPNRPDDPEYIVRLVGQVVRASVETVEIVNGLPAEFGGGE